MTRCFSWCGDFQRSEIKTDAFQCFPLITTVSFTDGGLYSLVSEDMLSSTYMQKTCWKELPSARCHTLTLLRWNAVLQPCKDRSRFSRRRASDRQEGRAPARGLRKVEGDAAPDRRRLRGHGLCHRERYQRVPLYYHMQKVKGTDLLADFLHPNWNNSILAPFNKPKLFAEKIRTTFDIFQFQKHSVH